MSDIDKINYEPLEADKHAFTMAYKQHTLLNTTTLGGGILLFIVGFFALNSFMIGWIGLALAILRLFYLSAQVRSFKNGVWEQFATANDWPIGLALDPATLLPLSLLFGRDQSYSPVIDAVLGDANADMFVYQTVTGSGKSQQTYVFTIARVMMPAAMPHIFLRAKGNVWSTVRPEFEDHETLSLEGDFNDYFSLQIEEGQEVNVLEILTPDVMQSLVSYSQKEDIEILGKSLFFILSGDARTPESTNKLVESVAALSSQIAEQIALTTVPQTESLQRTAAEQSPTPGVTAAV